MRGFGNVFNEFFKNYCIEIRTIVKKILLFTFIYIIIIVRHKYLYRDQLL